MTNGSIRICIATAIAAVLMATAAAASAVPTGPVDRKWGLGWDDGLTARLWLGGVWELALSAGPEDILYDGESSVVDTGDPPDSPAMQADDLRSTRVESGFVRIQGGRLIARRGSVAAVCFAGVKYRWSDGRQEGSVVDALDPSNTSYSSLDTDTSLWVVSLGLRPSFEVLGFLTIETAFGLTYSWAGITETLQTSWSETGRSSVEVSSGDTKQFDDVGWDGMGSLQFIVWF